MLISILIFLVLFFTALGVLLFVFNAKHSSLPIGVKIAIFILLVLFAISEFIILPVTFTNIHEDAMKDPNITKIEFSQIYKGDESNIYYIKEADSNELKAVTANGVFKGDSNYIMRIDYPNMTDSKSFWIDDEKVAYYIVTTNPNSIKKIPEMK